ncbi:MAG TPA: cyclic nucleotide-binding domain-containing protein [archaeon]|nr:cyclic nucleotide-binding domain-containing protein [archaeon]
MVKQGNVQNFEPGQLILRENSPGDSAYIILSGKVEVSKVIEGQRIVLDRLGPGSIFGEMSLIDGQPRSASVTAVEPTRLSVIDRPRFQAILNLIPKEVRPLFTSLSERLRNTNQMVSTLSLRERLIYSVCALICTLGSLKGIPREQGFAYPYRELLLEICRVLAFSQKKIEEALDNLAQTELIRLETAGNPDDSLLLVPETELFGAFVDFLAERLSHLPGFPMPSCKYSVLDEKAQEILYFLKNQSGSLPRDDRGRSHYDFDRYVKDSVRILKYGVKDAILQLQKLAGSGAIKLVKFSDVVQNKAIVYNVADISQAQLILLQANEFDAVYKKLMKKG